MGKLFKVFLFRRSSRKQLSVVIDWIGEHKENYFCHISKFFDKVIRLRMQSNRKKKKSWIISGKKNWERSFVVEKKIENNSKNWPTRRLWIRLESSYTRATVSYIRKQRRDKKWNCYNAPSWITSMSSDLNFFNIDSYSSSAEAFYSALWIVIITSCFPSIFGTSCCQPASRISIRDNWDFFSQWNQSLTQWGKRMSYFRAVECIAPQTR